MARDNMKTRKLLAVVSDLSASKCIANVLLKASTVEKIVNVKVVSMKRYIMESF